MPFCVRMKVEGPRSRYWSAERCGFGIWWIPRGTVWTVWGFDAIQLELSSGRVFRIGTDEPEALLATLEGRVLVH